MKPKSFGATLLLVLALGISTVARADSVGVNFVGGQPFFTVPAGPVTGTAGAPGLTQSDWNNLSGNSGSASSLINSMGQTTGIGLTWNSVDAWQSLNGAPATQNAQLMNGYLDNTVQISATGIKYGTYDVIVYFNGDTPSENRVSQFQVGSTSIFAQDNSPFSGTFIQVPSTSNADLGTSTPAGNYVVFYNVSGSSFTLDATPGSTLGTPRAVVNAVQIVSTAEPTTLLLLMAGSVCFGTMAFVRGRSLARS
jgi:hypothetical protein